MWVCFLQFWDKRNLVLLILPIILQAGKGAVIPTYNVSSMSSHLEVLLLYGVTQNVVRAILLIWVDLLHLEVEDPVRAVVRWRLRPFLIRVVIKVRHYEEQADEVLSEYFPKCIGKKNKILTKEIMILSTFV